MNLGATPCCGLVKRDRDEEENGVAALAMLDDGICPDCDQSFTNWLLAEEAGGHARQTNTGWHYNYNRAVKHYIGKEDLKAYTCYRCREEFDFEGYRDHFTAEGKCPVAPTHPEEILIQSHEWGRDVTLGQYVLPFLPARITAVYENMVTGYCGGSDHPAVGQVISGDETDLRALKIRGDDFKTKEAAAAYALSKLVGCPGGYQHCRLQVVVEPISA